MKKIGIIICNYNKSDYLVNCITSVIESSFKNLDIIVVDNASTDDSIKQLKKFEDKIYLIQNIENIGGSGGFNTGLKRALKQHYEYIMLIDNDVILDKMCIQVMYEFMENRLEIGMLGAKILKMDFPDTLQELGGNINYKTLGVTPLFSGEKDSLLLPELVYCDYVAACALMVRTSAVRKVGLMPQENFIYWDDMEWGYKFNKYGYKVAAYSKAKVWHKGGITISKNTFQTYYWYRNKIRFFLNYHDNIENNMIINNLLEEIFRAIYACFYSERYHKLQTLMDAFLDAISGIGGKADEYKIRMLDIVKSPFEELLDMVHIVAFKINDYWDEFYKIYEKIYQYKKKVKVIIISDSYNLSKEELQIRYPECRVINSNQELKYDILFEVCEHIFLLKEKKFNKIYIDGWCNIVKDQEQLNKCSAYNDNLELFQLSYQNRILNYL